MKATGDATRPGRGEGNLPVQMFGLDEREHAPASGHGLTSQEAAQRLIQHGRNEITRDQATSPWRILAGQFGSPVIWLLLVAAVIAGSLGEVVDATAIGMIVIINALVGFFQEYRAERAVLALRSMTAPQAASSEMVTPSLCRQSRWSSAMRYSSKVVTSLRQMLG